MTTNWKWRAVYLAALCLAVLTLWPEYAAAQDQANHDEDAPHVSGQAGTMALCVRNDAGTVLAGTTGDYIPCTTDSSGNLRTVAGAEVPGTGATNLGKAEDAAAVSGDTGVSSLAVQQASPQDDAADGDYANFKVSGGRLWVSGVTTSLVPGVAATSLGKAEDAVHASGDTGVMALGVRQDAFGTPLAATTGDYIPLMFGARGELVTSETLLPADTPWSYAAATGGISNSTTAVTIKTADAALRNYIRSCQLSSDTLGAATELALRDGAGGTVLWRTKLGTAGLVGGEVVNFVPPLRGTAATLTEVVTLTASITGGVFVNCQGFVAP